MNMDNLEIAKSKYLNTYIINNDDEIYKICKIYYSISGDKQILFDAENTLTHEVKTFGLWHAFHYNYFKFYTGTIEHSYHHDELLKERKHFAKTTEYCRKNAEETKFQDHIPELNISKWDYTYDQIQILAKNIEDQIYFKWISLLQNPYQSSYKKDENVVYIGSETIPGTDVVGWYDDKAKPYYLSSKFLTYRRIHKIIEGRYVDFSEESSATNAPIIDKALKDLKKNDNKIKTIYSTLEKKQYEIINNTSNDNIIVDGCAGSGKSAILFYKIAYLQRNDILTDKFLVLNSTKYLQDSFKKFIEEQKLNIEVAQISIQDFYKKIFENYKIKIDSGYFFDENNDNFQDFVNELTLNKISSISNRIINKTGSYYLEFIEHSKNAFLKKFNSIFNSKFDDFNELCDYIDKVNDDSYIKKEYSEIFDLLPKISLRDIKINKNDVLKYNSILLLNKNFREYLHIGNYYTAEIEEINNLHIFFKTHHIKKYPETKTNFNDTKKEPINSFFLLALEKLKNNTEIIRIIKKLKVILNNYTEGDFEINNLKLLYDDFIKLKDKIDSIKIDDNNTPNIKLTEFAETYKAENRMCHSYLDNENHYNNSLIILTLDYLKKYDEINEFTEIFNQIPFKNFSNDDNDLSKEMRNIFDDYFQKDSGKIVYNKYFDKLISLVSSSKTKTSLFNSLESYKKIVELSDILDVKKYLKFTNLIQSLSSFQISTIDKALTSKYTNPVRFKIYFKYFINFKSTNHNLVDSSFGSQLLSYSTKNYYNPSLIPTNPHFKKYYVSNYNPKFKDELGYAFLFDLMTFQKKLRNFNDFIKNDSQSFYFEIFKYGIRKFYDLNKLNSYTELFILDYCANNYLTTDYDFKYIFIDEVQNYSLFELSLLHKIFSKSIFCLFGDMGQKIEDKGINSLETDLNFLKPKIFKLNINFRNARQITKHLNKKFSMKMEAIGQEGEVKQINIPKNSRLRLAAPSKNETFALIYKNKGFKEFINIDDSTLFNIVNNKNGVKQGYINIISINDAKGLEFNEVFVFEKDMTRQEQYVAESRALSKLEIII